MSRAGAFLLYVAIVAVCTVTALGAVGFFD